MPVNPGETNGGEILTKAKAVLDVLARGGQSSVSHIAESAGEPVSSTYRLLTRLTALGWVEHGTERGLYRLGVYFIRMGGLVEGRLHIQRIAYPVLRELSTALRSVCSLFVRRGLHAVCIEMAEDEVIRRFAFRVGDSLPLNVGAASSVLIGFLPLSERESVLGQLQLERIVSHDRRRIEKDSEAVRTLGYAADIGETVPGVASIGAPVFNHRGEIEAALCVSGLHLDKPGGSAAAADAAKVVQAALRISAGLGYGCLQDS